MQTQFEEVATEDELEDLFAKSQHSPVVLYLHDPYCGPSSVAHAEVSQLGVRVSWINIHSGHDLSMEVERLTGVRHECLRRPSSFATVRPHGRRPTAR